MPALSFNEALKSSAALLKNLATIQPRAARLTIGLDVGSTSVKAVALGARRGKGMRPIVGHSMAPLGAGQEGELAEAVKSALAALKVPVSAVTMSVSGPWVLMRIIEIPKMRPSELRQALPFEAQRYLPFNIQDVVLDGAVLGPSDKNKVWVVIIACKKELLGRRVDGVKRAGIGVRVIDADALALANTFLEHEEGRAEGTRALVNIGAQLANLAIIRGGVPYLVRDIPWGGDKLIRQVAEQTGQEAGAVSQELAQATAGPETLNALKLACEPLVTELQLSFDYFENRFNQPPDEMLVTGGLSLSAPFLEALKGQVAQVITPWAPANDLSRQFTIAYGLALRDQ